MTLNCMVFDIETIPDVDLGRRLLDMEAATDGEVAEAMFAARREETGAEFLPYEQHRIAAISVALRTGEQFHVWSLGSVESPEDELVARFFGGLEMQQIADVLGISLSTVERDWVTARAWLTRRGFRGVVDVASQDEPSRLYDVQELADVARDGGPQLQLFEPGPTGRLARRPTI